jgi:hypothetical protein
MTARRKRSGDLNPLTPSESETEFLVAQENFENFENFDEILTSDGEVERARQNGIEEAIEKSEEVVEEVQTSPKEDATKELPDAVEKFSLNSNSSEDGQTKRPAKVNHNLKVNPGRNRPKFSFRRR